MSHTEAHTRWDRIRRLLLEHEQSFSDSLDSLSVLEAENTRLRDELANAVLGQARAEADASAQIEEAKRLRTEVERLRDEIRRVNMRREVGRQLAVSGAAVGGSGQVQSSGEGGGVGIPLRTGSDAASTSSSNGNSTTRPKRNPKDQKVYCTYWIRNGECSFVQGGCMYKHEMPADKETLKKVFGTDKYPNWWVRRQGELEFEEKAKARGDLERRVGGGGGGKRRKREA